jgi:hypothetical protein
MLRGAFHVNRRLIVGGVAVAFMFVAAPVLADDEVVAPSPPFSSAPAEEVAPAPPPPVSANQLAMPATAAAQPKANLAAATPTTMTATATPAEPARNTNANNNNNNNPPKSEKTEGEARDPNAGEHFRIGPLVGVGFPRPLAVEGLVKIERVIGIGAEYSFLPKVNLFGADTTFKAIAADVRVFPFKGAFFVGARAGRQWLDARTTVSVGQGGTTVGSFTETMEAATWFVNPRVGFLKTWDSGITLGIDAGVQFPINPTYERSGPATTAGAAANTGVDNTLRGVAGALGNNITPTIDMLRLGFMF